MMIELYISTENEMEDNKLITENGIIPQLHQSQKA
jgi:hypothetical protein